MWRRVLPLRLPACLASVPALAHPHVFTDTRIEVIVNDRDEATALGVGWTGDDLCTLVFFGDLGLDPDGDGHLAGASEEVLRAVQVAQHSVQDRLAVMIRALRAAEPGALTAFRAVRFGHGVPMRQGRGMASWSSRATPWCGEHRSVGRPGPRRSRG